METLWGDENPAPAIQPKLATKKPKPTTSIKHNCVYYGHIWRAIGMLGEKQCSACGIKIYCPICTKHPPINAKPMYCSLHSPANQKK